jgi:hypothetical protein
MTHQATAASSADSCQLQLLLHLWMCHAAQPVLLLLLCQQLHMCTPVVPPTITPSTPLAICSSINLSYARRSNLPLGRYLQLTTWLSLDTKDHAKRDTKDDAKRDNHSNPSSSQCLLELLERIQAGALSAAGVCMQGDMLRT